MKVLSRRSSVRQALVAVLPAMFGARAASADNPAQNPAQMPTDPGGIPDNPRLPNGKSQRDEILKAEYEQNLRDARELSNLAKSFELDLEKNDRFVLSLPLLKRLDEMEKLTKRIRARMRR